ncbi:MAG: signal recognition particle-docking protein FtsY [candidate division WOR-3 bacterium]|nr:signal recognition particle-docking protein FtsY [candidate division WOR-3 bacterium]
MNPFARIGAGFKKLAGGLAKTRQVFQRLLVAANTEELEEALLAADVGVKATGILVEKVKRATGDRREVLETEIARLLSPPQSLAPSPQSPPLVVMVVGVNGSGKTTTIGKLCRLFADQGQRVVVAAADTYRDAAAEQLGIWAERAGVEIVSSVQGQDAAAVAFDAIQKAVLKKMDVVLVDTAGRLHTRKDLMDEAVKIKRVCAKVKPGAPEEVWLVLDATVGQNGLRQAAAFNEQLGLTGLVVTKLDGTAKGGVLIPIVMELGVPVKFTGTGESLDDIEPFDPEAYSKALFEE